MQREMNRRTSSKFLEKGYFVFVLNFARSVRMPSFVLNCAKYTNSGLRN